MSSSVASVETQSFDRRILGAVSAITCAAVIVKLVATAKEFAVAGIFGRSDAIEAFLAATLIPGLLINFISESMNQALVPTLIRVRSCEGRTRAQQLLSNSSAFHLRASGDRIHSHGLHGAILLSPDRRAFRT